MNNSKIILDIILKSIQKKGITEKQCLVECNINTSFLTDWKNEKIKNPSIDKIIKLSEYLNIDLNYMLLGKEVYINDLSDEEYSLLEMYNKVDKEDKIRIMERAKTLLELTEAAKQERENQQQNSISCSDEDSVDKMYVDLFDLPASAGTGVYMNNNAAEPIEIDDTPENRKANFAVRVSGDSMEPRFYDGDLVLVQSTPVIDPWDIGIFIYDGCGYIKKFDGNSLISLNPKYKPIKIKDWDSFYCKGRVISVIPHK